jgi:hypothetical protein
MANALAMAKKKFPSPGGWCPKDTGVAYIPLTPQIK